MEENNDNHTGDIEINDSEIAFDNLTILKEIGNIANLVREEDFLETVPKAKLRRVKWVPMFNCLKQGILDEMVHELASMWEYENMPEKIDVLEKQKEKFVEIETEKPVWRPQLGDVKSQLKAHDVANLQKQKRSLESLASEYESRVTRLKKTISAKRGYLKALQIDIQKYQKKSDECITKLNAKLESHSSLVAILSNNINVDDMEISKSEELIHT